MVSHPDHFIKITFQLIDQVLWITLELTNQIFFRTFPKFFLLRSDSLFYPLAPVLCDCSLFADGAMLCVDGLSITFPSLFLRAKHGLFVGRHDRALALIRIPTSLRCCTAKLYGCSIKFHRMSLAFLSRHRWYLL